MRKLEKIGKLLKLACELKCDVEIKGKEIDFRCKVVSIKNEKGIWHEATLEDNEGELVYKKGKIYERVGINYINYVNRIDQIILDVDL